MADVLARLAALEREVAALRAEVAAIERSRDLAPLLVRVRAAVGRDAFTLADLARHPDVAPAIAALGGARSVGTVFARYEGVVVDGVRVARVGRCNAGALWTVGDCPPR